MTKYLFLTIAILTVGLALAVNQCQNNAGEAERYKGNQDALMHRARFYQLSDSTNVASVERLRLTVDEMETERSYDTRIIKDLKIKLSRVQSTSTTATETTNEVKVQIKDSIVYREGKLTPIPCVDYQDPYLTFSGCTEKGTFKGTIQSRDTLRQIVHRVPRKFLFIKYGTKGVRQEVTMANHRSKITFSEYIEITK